jgi:hypothetical protein
MVRFSDAANPATLKFSNDKCYRGLRAQFGAHLPAQKPYLALPVLRAVPPDGCSELTIDPAHDRPLPTEYAVLVERGTCFFMIKACYAQQLEGARAVVVASNDTQVSALGACRALWGCYRALCTAVLLDGDIEQHGVHGRQPLPAVAHDLRQHDRRDVVRRISHRVARRSPRSPLSC